MITSDPDIREALAAEYVLGTLRGPARQRFSKYLRDDNDLQDRVANWEGRLSSLSLRVLPVVPAARVWLSLEKRLGWSQTNTQDQADSGGLTHLIDAWGGKIAALAFMLLLTVTLFVTLPDPVSETQQQTIPEAVWLAELTITDEQKNPLWSIKSNPGQVEAVIEVLDTPAIEDNQDLELWYIAGEGSAPVSVWVFPHQAGSKHTAILPAPLNSGALFAVSLEPKGGSPTGQPTGPVLYSAAYSEA